MNSCAHLPPVAKKKNHVHEKHGDQRQDPYFWMKERENPEVIAHLKAENSYTDAVLAPTKKLQTELFEEMKSRMKQDDSSVPFRMGPYFYYSRFETGKEYPIYARKKGDLNAPEEVLVDVNELAKGKSYMAVGFPIPSPDHSKIIFAVDDQGRRFYDLHFLDLSNRKEVRSPIKDVTGSAVWANDGKTFFYVKQDPNTLRSQWVYRSSVASLGSELVYEEKDDTFFAGITKSRSRDFIFIVSSASLSTEWQFLDANTPLGSFQIVHPREKEHEYSVEDGVDAFYMVTNWKAKNFRLMKAARGKSKKEDWKEVIAHNKDVLLEDVDFFQSHFVVQERFEGLSRLRVFDRASQKPSLIELPDPIYVVGGSTNAEYTQDFYRYSYQSMNRPESVFDYGFSSSKSSLKKQKETPNLDPSLYESNRVWATARDGVKVPISFLHKKGWKPEGKTPLYIYAYGSYGYSMEPSFSANVFSLLDRGFVFAIAHIRGGSEMGRHWYEDGKFLKKKNTFFDFIDCTEHLIKEGYADPKNVYAEGGSAGGLLMGAVANFRGDLYRGMVAGVPFVDVMTTMLDETIPLTTFEYDEWGNPNDKKYYDYMRSYSPYDNVERKAYPNILITSGLHDSQVQYWEPTKWTARLREYKTNESVVLLRTEMEAGHGGASGRFQKLKERAEEFAFFLWLRGGESLGK